MPDKSLPPSPARAVGRPRRLTVEGIVDAACEIGVASLDMGLVAERLNTGVATLYGYVRGREHLLELVAERLAGDSRLKERGQSWQDVIREHAATTYALFQSQPQLITNLMNHISDPASAKYWKHLFDLLSRRNISLADAIDIYVETNQAVIGAAICLMRRQTIERRNQSGEGPVLMLPMMMGDYKPTLERIISGFEQVLADRVTVEPQP